MTIHSFTLKCKLTEHLSHDEIMDRLYRAGCDDALVGLGQEGYIGLDFEREADTFEQALQSAQDDVGRAFPNSFLKLV